MRCSVYVLLTVLCTSTVHAQSKPVEWWSGYSEENATGPNILGYWSFETAESFGNDSSTHAHRSVARGAKWHADGRFGGCLESGAGYPVVDESHGLHVGPSPALAPAGAFTAEMWIRAKDDENFEKAARPVLLDMKYVNYDHTGYQFSLPKVGPEGLRQLAVQIGLGERSEQWYSRAFRVEPGRWVHLAFTYNAAGTVNFYVDGAHLGRVTKPGAGSMAESPRQLSIGDRIGSLYSGFPGHIDEVRLSKGVLDFRPIRFDGDVRRFAFRRHSGDAKVSGQLRNQTSSALREINVTLQLPGGVTRQVKVAELLPGKSAPVEFPIDTTVSTGTYDLELTVAVPNWAGSNDQFETQISVPLVVVPRPLPERMPVVMWGVGGVENLVEELPRLKQIGFTHCLGLEVNYQKIWDEGADALPTTPDRVRAARNMLNAALESDMGVVVSLSPGSWLRRAGAGKEIQRRDRNGNPYGRHDIVASLPQIQTFGYNVGTAFSRAYGDHPAFSAALLHTEVRGESQVSFHPHEVAAYRLASGGEIPAEVKIKNGVVYGQLTNFPEDRVIADDHPILNYLRWFWQRGDGWNDLNTRVDAGLKEGPGREQFWTFYDPAVRVPSISGSGGNVDVLSHWTYSYPDPIRIGLCTDELFEMARVGGRDQDVMKMTQVIWYRSQTAPPAATPTGEQSPWVDRDPDAAYISIAPMHLREAFWWKISRPIKGIMYHGWQSLVPTETVSAYRYTNPNTKNELQRLVQDVVVPLGPTLRQVPDPKSDVVFLESFTSQMFARRGTYGWNHTWAGDLYHALMYAQLQPRVAYEESVLSGGLDGAKVLVMADCDVLTQSVVSKIKAFQAAGGLIIGDGEVCPAIQPDLVVPRFSRTKRADADRAKLQEVAGEIREWLDGRYARVIDSSNLDVVTRRRRFGSTDYVFAVNDRREFGNYVGGYGLVMEDGLPALTTVTLNRKSGSIYDLVQQRELSAVDAGDSLQIPLSLGPCQGRVLMITERPIREIQANLPEEARRGDSIPVEFTITDGKQLVDAVIPVRVRITDPEGVVGEYSGYYGAAGGKLEIQYDFAPNDQIGLWEFNIRELASGRTTSGYVRLR